jgi:MFS family permease
MCFFFFFLYAVVISGVQAFAPEAARLLHGIPTALAAICLTVYMVANACGMVAGGFLAADPVRAERIVGAGFAAAAAVALVVALVPLPSPVVLVPLLFALMGAAAGTAGPSRDLIVKRAAPPNATGRVYGVVYSGLDIGQAAAPLLFGMLLDGNHPAGVWISIAVVQALLVASAFNVSRVRRTPIAPAAA